ncbi:hypothetical protein [Bacillus suaedae]|uniref:Uncharacterized protein n=1 Tax=Halalkalibacter suaedae TaxID=2822140 RepID=A0A940WQH5_9BACI|nr:hypothetical protein [Bacillus suaedae]MBP3950660.1 hypothetical protein [Bacillus suaedae]
MREEIWIIIVVFVLFLLIGVAGALAFFFLFKGKKRKALWSLVIGLVLIIVYIVSMFSIKL